jgi:hypothetical protein
MSFTLELDFFYNILELDWRLKILHFAFEIFGFLPLEITNFLNKIQ